MAQWYAHLLFKGDQLLGEGLGDLAQIEGVREGGAGDRYTAVAVSGYALYGRLRGYYSLGVSRIIVDPQTRAASYDSEESSLGTEGVDSLTPSQKQTIREWLIQFDPQAWENSTEPFKQNLGSAELQGELSE